MPGERRPRVRVGPLGGPDQTPCQHTTPPDPFHTCYHPYHADFSESRLPPILFRLDPPPVEQLPEVESLIEDNKPAKDRNGKPIRNFGFLPRYISIRPPGWLLEYWMRTDYRLTYKDIKARMTASPRELPLDNTLNMRREREARWPLALSCWTTRRGDIARVEVERVERWTNDQLAYNTTMLIEYSDTGPESSACQPNRLIAKQLLPTQEPPVYPLDTFLDDNSRDGFHRPSERITAAVGLFYRLSERAKELGLPSWHSLPVHELPPSWKPIQQRRSVSGGQSSRNAPGPMIAAWTEPLLLSGDTAAMSRETAVPAAAATAANSDMPDPGAVPTDPPASHAPRATARETKKRKKQQKQQKRGSQNIDDDESDVADVPTDLPPSHLPSATVVRETKKQRRQQQQSDKSHTVDRNSGTSRTLTRKRFFADKRKTTTTARSFDNLERSRSSSSRRVETSSTTVRSNVDEKRRGRKD